MRPASPIVFWAPVVCACGLIIFGGAGVPKDLVARDLSPDHTLRVDQTRLGPDLGVAERLTAAGAVRTLPQDLRAAACHLHHGIAVAESRARLLTATADILKLLDALEFGDPDLRIIGAEDRRQTRDQIATMRNTWRDTRAAVTSLLSDPRSGDALQAVRAQIERLYPAAMRLQSEISGQYSNPVELLQVDALMIDIVGRLAMLTQTMASVSCEISMGVRSDALIADLSEARSMFTFGVRALYRGVPATGIKPAPTPEIARHLPELLSDWSVIQQYLDAVVSDSATVETQTSLFHLLSAKMYKIEQVAALYTEHAKRIHDW